MASIASSVDEVKGKVALLTGAASGIGRAVAELLHARGAKVVAEDIDPAVKELERDGLISLTADVTADGSAEKAVALAVDRFGTLDILVNNAGRIVYKELCGNDARRHGTKAAVPYHWGRYRGLAQDMKKPRLDRHLLNNVFFDTCVYHQPGVELLAKVIPIDNILFGSEMIGAVRGIDPETGFYYDDTKRYIEAVSFLDDAARRKILELNARRVYRGSTPC
jgi:NAD(P)-dependent dehydrogenase (short-subunit alcohol dehydrogenase family)